VDPSVSEERKSEPLYRDLSESKGAVRAKYLGFEKIDVKTVAMGMIHKGDTKSLAELALCRNVVGRGGEHLYLCWNEASYHPYFMAPDIDWKFLKQSDDQCLLLFCDRHLYCLCPFFALGVYFLFGGLRREGVSNATKDFVFSYLRNMKKDNVAARLTTAI
jgi:hypothetical protein